MLGSTSPDPSLWHGKYDERQIDIHHISPRKWWEDMGIPPRVFNSIVNKMSATHKE
ncbi:MAG: hypothetical protein ACT4QB_18065 [Gammaproteobacteria bacterium]